MEQSANMGTPPGSQAPLPPSPKGAIGPLVGTAIIIVLLVAGGLYFWGAKLNQNASMNNAPPVILGDDSAGLPPTSSSDAVAAIEADVSATDVDRLDAEIEADMKAAESSM